jgi:hypothetical protein
MNPTTFAAPNRDSSASERAVPVVPEQRVFYLHPETGYSSYGISPAPSFAFEVRQGSGYWIVRDAETGIYGDAEDALGALKDFFRAVEQHLDVLERQDALSDALFRQRDYLRARVRR